MTKPIGDLFAAVDHLLGVLGTVHREYPTLAWGHMDERDSVTVGRHSSFQLDQLGAAGRSPRGGSVEDQHRWFALLSGSSAGILDHAQVGELGLEAFGVLLGGLLVGHPGDDDHIVALLPVGGCGDLLGCGELH